MKKVVMIVALLGVSGLQAECYCKRQAAKQEQKKENTRTKNPVKAVGRAARDGSVKVMETTAKAVKKTGEVAKKATTGLVNGFFNFVGNGLDRVFGKK